jgi:ketosteroid isomerase-like protein
MQPTTLLTNFVLLSAAVGCGSSPTAQLQANKDLVRRFSEASNAGDWEAVAALLTDDFARHSVATAGPAVTSRAEFIQLQQSFSASITDAQATMQQIIADGDRVATLATHSGTQTGPMGDFSR